MRLTPVCEEVIESEKASEMRMDAASEMEKCGEVYGPKPCGVPYGRGPDLAV